MLAIKYLVTETEADVIASGSMLGVDRNPPRSYPVGYVHEVRMHPMDFEEHLWAIGMPEEETDDIREHIRTGAPFDPIILCAIEVKSGKNRKARSLKKLMEMEQGARITRWMKFGYGNIMRTEDGVEHHPLFPAAFADSLIPPAHRTQDVQRMRTDQFRIRGTF